MSFSFESVTFAEVVFAEVVFADEEASAAAVAGVGLVGSLQMARKGGLDC